MEYLGIANDNNGLLANIFETIATSKPTVCIGETLCWMHDVSGLDWYAIIILSTMVFRFIMMGQAHITSRKVHNHIMLKLFSCLTPPLPPRFGYLRFIINIFIKGC